MSTKRCAVFVAFVMLFSIACAKPQYTRRHKVAPPTIGTGSVDVTASVFSIDPASQRSVFDLSSEGQAALITALAASGSGLHEALATPIARSAAVTDKTTASRRIVLSVSADHKRFGDRLDFSSVKLTLQDGARATFKSWNQLATKFEVVDLGKLTFTQKDSLSLSLKGVLPGVSEISEATAGGARDRTLGEEVQLRQRYVATTGALTPKAAMIVQQGAVNIDLIGNTVLDVSLASGQTQEARLYSTGKLFVSGKPTPPDQVTLSRKLVRFAESASDWIVDVSAQFRRRGVIAGGETVTESDDIVEYEDLSRTAAALTVVTADDLKVSKWRLYNAACDAVHVVESSSPVPVVLEFDSFDGAEAMLTWLRESNSDTIAGRALGFYRGAGVTTAATGSRWVGLRVEIEGLNWKVPGGCNAAK